MVSEVAPISEDKSSRGRKMWQSSADHLMADREGLDQDMASKETRDSGDLQRHSQRCSPGLLGIHWSSLQMTRLPILAHHFPPTAGRE